MKKISLKSKILLGAILIGGSMAGAHAFVNSPNPQEPRYNWEAESNSPLNPGGILLNQTVSEAEDHFGCKGEEKPCATGELESGNGPETVFLRFN